MPLAFARWFCDCVTADCCCAVSLLVWHLTAANDAQVATRSSATLSAHTSATAGQRLTSRQLQRAAMAAQPAAGSSAAPAVPAGASGPQRSFSAATTRTAAADVLPRPRGLADLVPRSSASLLQVPMPVVRLQLSKLALPWLIQLAPLLDIKSDVKWHPLTSWQPRLPMRCRLSNVTAATSPVAVALQLRHSLGHAPWEALSFSACA